MPPHLYYKEVTWDTCSWYPASSVLFPAWLASYRGKSTGIEARQVWVLILFPPLPGSVPLGTLNPSFLICKMGTL